jgi:ParB-like nuclease domain
MAFADDAMNGPLSDPPAARPFSSVNVERSSSADHGVHTIPLSKLLPADSPRLAGEDENHTRRLVETEAELPPILVHRDTMRVIDGMHRLRAAMASGKQEISVRFFDGDENEAFLHAVRENVTHGLPLTLDDRRAAAQRIISSSPHLSDRAIGKYTGLSDKTVSALRERSSAEGAQSSKRVGIDGRARPLNSSEGRRHAMELMTARPDASLREVASRAGISVGTAHDVRKRMQRGEDPLHTRQHGARPGGHSPADLPGQIVTARRSSRDVTDFDPQALLESLIQDPAIRQSESGRSMLRWLHAHVVRGADVDPFVDAVPPHRTDCAISLAEHCAGVWHRVADRLATERKLHDQSGAA